ncbi:MAG: hypothetical protein E6R04_02470 [Spirochaetes bacterium]|nr:MAG: hypothetical protein E6R04_02470 [Spirochaetota bacterium]
METIPPFLKQRIDEVIGYIGDSTTDYLIIKRQLINNFPTPSRGLFSARHPCTKKHTLNDFDRAVMAYWEQETGVELKLDPGKLHDPGWEQKKKGWALVLLNEQRRKRHHEAAKRKAPRNSEACGSYP